MRVEEFRPSYIIFGSGFSEVEPPRFRFILQFIDDTNLVNIADHAREHRNRNTKSTKRESTRFGKRVLGSLTFWTSPILVQVETASGIQRYC